MNVERREDRGIAIYDFDGRIDFHPYDLLDQKVLKDALSLRPTAVILNFTNLKYISSLGIRYIYDIKNDLAKARIDFAITGASEAIQQVFRLLGLFETFSLYPTEQQAIEKLIRS
jgi:anti-anti-sigma factor